MTRFQVAIISADHVIITSRESMPPEIQMKLLDAFHRWKAEGGIFIIPEAEIVATPDAPSYELGLDSLIGVAE